MPFTGPEGRILVEDAIRSCGLFPCGGWEDGTVEEATGLLAFALARAWQGKTPAAVRPAPARWFPSGVVLQAVPGPLRAAHRVSWVAVGEVMEVPLRIHQRLAWDVTKATYGMVVGERKAA